MLWTFFVLLHVNIKLILYMYAASGLLIKAEEFMTDIEMTLNRIQIVKLEKGPNKVRNPCYHNK